MAIDIAAKRRMAACFMPFHKAPIPGAAGAKDRAHIGWVYGGIFGNVEGLASGEGIGIGIATALLDVLATALGHGIGEGETAGIRIVINVRRPPKVHTLGKTKPYYTMGKPQLEYTLGKVKVGSHNLGRKVE